MICRVIAAAASVAAAIATQSVAQNLDFDVPQLVTEPPEPIEAPPTIPGVEPLGPSLSESIGPTGLPDLGGLIIGPPDIDPSATESIIAGTWPEGIASVRAAFHPSSPWYQAVLNTGEAYGAQGFLDHHYAALGRFSDAIVRNGDGQFSSRLLAHWDYLTTLTPFIPTAPGQQAHWRPLSETEMRTLFAIRLFDSFPAPTQDGRGRLALSHSDTQLLNGTAINIPIAADDLAETRAFRRVSFTATATTEEPVDLVRFAVTSPYPFDIVTSDAQCSGEEPVLCEMAGGAPYTLEIEVLGPEPTSSIDAIWQSVDVSVAVWRDGIWQDEAADSWGQSFRQCDAVFVDRINSQIDAPGDLRSLFDRLSDLTAPNSGLPGRRLYDGPTRTALPQAGGETRDIPTHPEALALAARIDQLARDLGLDSYLEGDGTFSGGLNTAVAAAQRYGAMLQCNRQETADHYDAIGVQLDTVERQLDAYQAPIAYAALGRGNWVARVEAQRLVLQSMSDVNGTGGDAVANFVSGQAESVLQDGIITGFAGAKTAALLSSATGVISQALVYLQIIATLREADMLLDWQQTISEANAFLEAEAYLRGMEGQYLLAQEDLTALLLRLRQIEAAACTCYLPVDRN